jgi:dolichol-phosphate mannosyltransferase
VTSILYAVVPLFDEAENVTSLVASLSTLARAVEPGLALEVLFVDDGSRDGTVERLGSTTTSLRHRILRHPSNLGPGAAFATAFRALHGQVRSDDWVLTMEGDSTSTPETISHLLTHRKGGDDVILASPHLEGGGFTSVSAGRILMSRVANGLIRLRLGVREIRTWTSFLRLYRGSALIHLQARYGPGIVHSRGFESMVELLGKIVQSGLAVSEVPVRIDGSGRRGNSKMKITRAVASHGRLLLRWKSLSRPIYPSSSQAERSLR